ncbi:MAG: sulfatase-like hydrolase/transferase [Candidatus Hydrogenedentes bacterium]|nr:sulfatase-like hydrolase/transferase [Candidatus Hydrogenedentota bacterium]
MAGTCQTNRSLSRRTFLVSATAAMTAASCATPRSRVLGDKPPNIVIILADDFGVGDIAALNEGRGIPTPCLDHFVSQSMSFTDAHSASAVCSPTRYGLLTGRYCWRTCLQSWVLDAYEPPLIAEDRLTLPKMLKKHGYATACIGKWHLGSVWAGEGEARKKKADFSVPIQQGPITRGFDYYFGTEVPNFPPFTFIENDHVLVQPTDQMPENDASVHVGFQGAPMAPGWKFDEILPTLTSKCAAYIHEQAQSKQPFFLYFPMTSPHEPVSPSGAFKGKSGIAPIADFLMETDWSAGQVLGAIDAAGISDNTIVIFAGDNGHSAYTGFDVLVQHGHMPSGPYRGHKGEIWEGGHRVPFIVRWPGKVAPGSSCDQLACLNDVMATCAELVGAKLPEDSAEDSVSLLPALLGRAEAPLREALVHHDVKGQFAIRQGPWKLVILAGKDSPPAFELYDLGRDIAEARNVAGQHADVVARMLKLLDEYVAKGRSTPGPQQANDTLDIDVRHIPKERWARPRT